MRTALLATLLAAVPATAQVTDTSARAPVVPMRLGWVETPFVPPNRAQMNVSLLVLNDLDVRLDDRTRLSAHAPLPLLALRLATHAVRSANERLEDVGASVDVHRHVHRFPHADVYASVGAAADFSGLVDDLDAQILADGGASALPARLRGRVTVGHSTRGGSWMAGAGGALAFSGARRTVPHAVVGGDVRVGGRWRLAADVSAVPWSDSLYVGRGSQIQGSGYVHRRLVRLPFSAVLQHTRPGRGGPETFRVGLLGETATRPDALPLDYPFGNLSWLVVPVIALAFPLGR